MNYFLRLFVFGMGALFGYSKRMKENELDQRFKAVQDQIDNLFIAHDKVETDVFGANLNGLGADFWSNALEKETAKGKAMIEIEEEVLPMLENAYSKDIHDFQVSLQSPTHFIIYPQGVDGKTIDIDWTPSQPSKQSNS